MVTKSCKSNVLLSNLCLTYLSACRTLACRTPWNVQLALFIAMVTRLITIVTKVITNLHMSTKQHKVLATQATIQEWSPQWACTLSLEPSLTSTDMVQSPCMTYILTQLASYLINYGWAQESRLDPTRVTKTFESRFASTVSNAFRWMTACVELVEQVIARLGIGADGALSRWLQRVAYCASPPSPTALTKLLSWVTETRQCAHWL